jgi:UDP-N-acetylmuramoylalanine--D-glutamate ligase
MPETNEGYRIAMSDVLQGKTVVVLGFARQGQALARWLPTVGARVRVTDSKTEAQLQPDRAAYPDVEFVLGGHPDTVLDGADVVCVSGGVPLDLPIVRAAQARGIPLTNDAQLFLERCAAPVIGITGSAGKTTTTTLVGEMLRASYANTFTRVYVGGNIGEVLLDSLAEIRPTDHVVMELSSFQLELMTASPEIAAVLNITPNHLDRHGTMEAYIAAKRNIVGFQSDEGIAILGRDDANTAALADDLASRVAWFSGQRMVPDGAFLAGERLVLAGLCSPDRQPVVFGERSDIQLRGAHNVLNVLAACAIAGAAEVRPDTLIGVVRSFTGVPHRLEPVRTLNGVQYVNDSIATAPERVKAAVLSYDEPLVLLLGGRDKKLPWDDLLQTALPRVRAIVTFGELGDLVHEVLDDLGGYADVLIEVDTLEQAVQAARDAARPGDVVLLSPGGTSYDAYTDFAARGDHFRALVQAL